MGDEVKAVPAWAFEVVDERSLPASRFRAGAERLSPQPAAVLSASPTLLNGSLRVLISPGVVVSLSARAAACAVGVAVLTSSAPALANPAPAARSGVPVAFCKAAATSTKDLIAFRSATTVKSLRAKQAVADRDLSHVIALAPGPKAAVAARDVKRDTDAIVALVASDPSGRRPGTRAALQRLARQGRADGRAFGLRARALGCAPYFRG